MKALHFEDKHGTVSYPVVNDVEALHTFTNLSKPVDFAGRLVYNAEGLKQSILVNIKEDLL
jgi:DNA polymerase-3 subunit epsilon